MVVETEDREELTAETIEAPSDNAALMGWLSAMHFEMRSMRDVLRETRDELRGEMRETRDVLRGEIRETRRELLGRIERLEHRAERAEERVTRIEAGIAAERERKNRLIMWLGIGIGALIGAGGAAVVVIGLLN